MKKLLLTSLTAFSLTLPAMALDRYTPDYDTFFTHAATYCMTGSSITDYYGEGQGSVLCAFIADCYAAKITKRVILKESKEKAREKLYYKCQRKVLKAMEYTD